MSIDNLLPRDEISLATKSGKTFPLAEVLQVKRDRLQLRIPHPDTGGRDLSNKAWRDLRFSVPKRDVASVTWIRRKPDPFAKKVTE